MIVGGGPYEDHLRQLARKTGMDDHGRLHGHGARRRVGGAHTIADVFAMPCRTRGAGLDVEGLGIVYLEASATGVPVIAGRSGGAPGNGAAEQDRARGRRHLGSRRRRIRDRGAVRS